MQRRRTQTVRTGITNHPHGSAFYNLDENRVPGAEHLLLYYITDRCQFSGNAAQQRRCLLSKITEAARCGVNYIQLRERDLLLRDLEALARDAVQAIREGNTVSNRPPSCLLINSRTDVALAVGADGVHLRSDDISASDARAVWNKSLSLDSARGQIKTGIFAASCHTLAEVRLAEAHGADFAVFAPVFEKVITPARPGVGLDALREACISTAPAQNVEGLGSRRMPLLALGGVTLQNARACLEAGAAGIAAIRLFQENDVAEVVQQLRGTP